MGKFIDLTDKRFERLVVRKRVERPMQDKNKFAWWECECDCGNIIKARSGDLIRGHTRSCGCLNDDIRKSYKDLTGQRYGKLKVLRVISKPYTWECQCDCGNKKIIRSGDLKSGKTISCGCFHQDKLLKNLTGQRFGKLSVLKKLDRKNGKYLMWLCRCDCGTVKEISGDLLRKGHAKSCGCLNKEVHYLEFGLAAFNLVINAYKKRARVKGFDFALSEDEFRSIITKPCHYCGDMLTAQAKGSNNGINGRFKYTGIDRIDSRKGYTKDNIVPCCKICNRAKNSMKQDDFFKWLKRIANHYKEA